MQIRIKHQVLMFNAYELFDKYLEMAVRDLAANSLSTFTVWTGSYGVTTLDDVDGNPVEIWLGRSSSGALVKKLPVNQ